MSIRIYRLSSWLIAAVFLVSLLSPSAASASVRQAPAPVVLKPATMITTQGSVVGAVTRLRTQDQSGTTDTPANYVLFQTPGKTYKGYRTFNVPATISPSTISSIVIKLNYKGPLKGAQAWNWSLYDWVSSAWVKVGDNAAVTSSASWKVMQFSAPADVTRFINNTTRQIRLQLASNNALYDAKLDYEAITLSYDSCSDPLGCVMVRSGEPMHIAYLLNMNWGEGKNGGDVAAASAGTILGHPIQWDGYSRNNCDTAVSQADAAKILVDASVIAIEGTSCSSEAFAILPSVSAAGLSMVSPSNTNRDLTEPGTAGYFRVSWSDDAQGEVAAEYALSLGLTKAATIDDGTGYSAGIAQGFASRFVEGGVGTITSNTTINGGTTDFRSMLDDIAKDSPEMIFMPIFSPAAAYIINQARITSGLTSAYLMGSDALNDPSLILSTGRDLEGFLVALGGDADQFNQSLYTPFKTAYFGMFGSDPTPTYYAAYGADAFNIIKAAIEATAVDAGGGAHMIGRQALRDALLATSAFPGITGSITCKSNGDCWSGNGIAAYSYAFGASIPTKVWPVAP